MVVTINHNQLRGKELGYGSSSYHTGANVANVFRVEPGGHPPGTPTDPDVQISRIRFLSVIALLHKQSAQPCLAEVGSAEEAD